MRYSYNLGNIVYIEITYCIITFQMLPKGKSIEIETRLSVAWNGGKNWVGVGKGLTINGSEQSCWRNENILRLIYSDDCTLR